MKSALRTSLIAILCFAFLLRTKAEIPNCDFHDTVDLTDSKKFTNGSYEYQGVIIPANMTAMYDYEMLFENVKVYVTSHVRGCVCKIKSCIQFCCHPNTVKHETERSCRTDLQEEVLYDPYINIIDKNGVKKRIHALEDFVIQEYIPCKDTAGSLKTAGIKEWDLYENGTLAFVAPHKVYSYRKDHYCFNPHKENQSYELVPHYCPHVNVLPESHKWKIVCLAASVLGFLLTTIVYILLPSFQKRFGKCLVCYFVTLSIAFTMFGTQQFFLGAFVGVRCIILGYFTYFFFMSAFLWLSVISFEIWSHLKAKNFKWLDNRMLIFSLYSFGVAGIMTLLTFWAQDSNISDNLKPGIDANSCMINTHRYAAFIYFFGPIVLILIVNTLMFCSIFIHLKKSATSDRENRRVGTAKYNFKVYLRLFFLMGIFWILDVISFLIGKDLPTDYLVAIQGVVLFVLLVCKRSVWKALKDRILCRESQAEVDVTNYFEDEISLTEPVNAGLRKKDEILSENNAINTRVA